MRARSRPAGVQPAEALGIDDVVERPSDIRNRSFSPAGNLCGRLVPAEGPGEIVSSDIIVMRGAAMTAPALRVIDGAFAGFSPQQEEAFGWLLAWQYNRRSNLFYLAGPAGTGKTTLLHRLAGTTANVVFMAPTGRAAAVMRAKGCPGATTIDRAIYRHPFEWRCSKPGCAKPPCRPLCRQARQVWLGKRLDLNSRAAAADLIVIDEASMVSAEAGADLQSLGRPILAVGDPGQLPPVNGTGYLTGRKPDFLLTEVHRQAAGNPIIQLATMAREGRVPPLGHYGNSRVVRDADFDEDLTAFDAVICGKNDTRRQLNAQIRKALGFETLLPIVEERLLVLRNRHEKGLCNGDVVTVAEVDPGGPKNGFLRMLVVPEDGDPVEIDAPVELLLSDDADAIGATGDPCTWGYCLTVHKAQGSEWPTVLLIDESACFREHRWRWLYTGLTRAAQRVVVVRL